MIHISIGSVTAYHDIAVLFQVKALAIAHTLIPLCRSPTDPSLNALGPRGSGIFERGTHLDVVEGAVVADGVDLDVLEADFVVELGRIVDVLALRLRRVERYQADLEAQLDELVLRDLVDRQDVHVLYGDADVLEHRVHEPVEVGVLHVLLLLLVGALRVLVVAQRLQLDVLQLDLQLLQDLAGVVLHVVRDDDLQPLDLEPHRLENMRKREGRFESEQNGGTV